MTEGRENSPEARSEKESSRMSVPPSISLLPTYPLAVGQLLGPFLDPLQWLAFKCTTKGNLEAIERKTLELFQIVEVASECQEQNLEIVLKNGEFYFRAICDISRDSNKLSAWFSDELSSRLPLPSSATINGSKRYFCGLCNQVFLHPNPVVIHVLFSCLKRHEILPSNITSGTSSGQTTQTMTSVRVKKRGFDIESLVNDDKDTKKFRNDYEPGRNSNNHINNSRDGFQSPPTYLENQSQDRVPTASTSTTASSLLTSLSPMSTGLNSNHNVPSAFRKVDKSCGSMHNNNNNNNTTTSNNNNANYEYPSFYGNSRMMAAPSVFSSPNNYQLSSSVAPPPHSVLSSSGSSTANNAGTANNRSLIPPSLLPFIPPSLAALSFPQTNWCAKCNATFRMTSDLVYHMRSHHKNHVPTDPMKKKREEKLRCNICGETFRERHHLTRHMTSHQ